MCIVVCCSKNTMSCLLSIMIQDHVTLHDTILFHWIVCVCVFCLTLHDMFTVVSRNSTNVLVDVLCCPVQSNCWGHIWKCLQKNMRVCRLSFFKQPRPHGCIVNPVDWNIVCLCLFDWHLFWMSSALFFRCYVVFDSVWNYVFDDVGSRTLRACWQLCMNRCQINWNVAIL